MEQEIKLLIINPGSTSTKISIFENGVERYKKSLSHPASEWRGTPEPPTRPLPPEGGGGILARLTMICPADRDVARGAPCRRSPEAYVVNGEMIDVLRNRPIGQHASTTAAIIALDMAKRLHIPAYIYDGNTADEMGPVSQISGCPLVPRLSMGHILNTKAVGRMYAQRLGRKYEELNLIMVHLGGGISIGLHKRGVIADIMTDEEGTFSPERAGGLPSIGWARVCCSGDYTFEELSAMVRGKGGLTAYLGTNDVREVEAKVRAGDKKAALIYEAMIYQTAKCIGGLAAAADGEIDGVVLTGGIANSELLVEKLRRKVRFIAPVAVIPGEFEMEALAAGITRVLKGEEGPGVPGTRGGRSMKRSGNVSAVHPRRGCRGALAAVGAPELGALVIAEAVRRAGLQGEEVEEVIFGNLGNNDSANLAQVVTLQAGLPFTVPAITIDRQCSSGLNAIAIGALMIEAGEADIVVAGGTESDSNRPHLMEKARVAYQVAPPQWLVRRTAPGALNVSMGTTAENLGRKYPITREVRCLRPGEPPKGGRRAGGRPV